MGCLCTKKDIKEPSVFNVEDEMKSIQNQNNENKENPEFLNPVFLKKNINKSTIKNKTGISIINFNNNEDPLISGDQPTPGYVPNNTNNSNIISTHPEDVQNSALKKVVSKTKYIKNFSKMTSIELDPQTAYNSRAIHLINEIRRNPSWYSGIIKNEISNIKEEIKTKVNPKTFIEEEIKKIYYEKKVKVLLNRGKNAFKEAADYFSHLSPMEPLEMKGEICIELPSNINETCGGAFFKDKVKEIRKKNNLNRFFVDNVKNPEVGILLMMVDDYANNIHNEGDKNDGNNNNNNSNGKNRFAKRDALMNKEYKYIGIDNKFIDKRFVAVYSLAK